MDNMITKEVFIEIINKIQHQEQIDQEISKSLEKVCGSWVLFNCENYIYSALFDLLKETFNDTEDWIGWWLYETAEKKIWEKDGTERNLAKVEDLYDFLIKNMEDKGDESK